MSFTVNVKLTTVFKLLKANLRFTLYSVRGNAKVGNEMAIKLEKYINNEKSKFEADYVPASFIFID